MPQDIKMRGGRLKHALKEAVSPLLPPDILERGKRGFGTPIGAWLKEDLRPLMHQLLSDEAIAARGLFDPAPVRELIAQHEAKRVDGTDRLLALMNLEIWARMFLDGHAAQDVGAELEAIA
jgi:asparagine synthase (glutamine-hydrolysing)